MSSKPQATPQKNLGSKELRLRHNVAITGGQHARARVLDQTIFDHLLNCHAITFPQYQAGEHMMKLAVTAGLWAKGQNWDGGVSSTPGSRVPFGAAPFFGALGRVRAAAGSHTANVLLAAIRDDYDPRVARKNINELRAALGIVSDRVMMGQSKDPLRHLST